MIHLMKSDSSPGTFHSLGTTSWFPFLLPSGQEMGYLILCCVIDIPYPKPTLACVMDLDTATRISKAPKDWVLPTMLKDGELKIG